MTLRSTNPATGELVGEVPVTPPADVPAIVARARAAQPAWAALGTAGRAERLASLAGRIREQLGDLAQLLTREMGKPVKEAKGEVQSVADGVEHELAEI